jgi:hypothetical protein
VTCRCGSWSRGHSSRPTGRHDWQSFHCRSPRPAGGGGPFMLPTLSSPPGSGLRSIYTRSACARSPSRLSEREAPGRARRRLDRTRPSLPPDRCRLRCTVPRTSGAAITDACTDWWKLPTWLMPRLER